MERRHPLSPFGRHAPLFRAETCHRRYFATHLTRQLRELESDQLISRKVYPVVPPKVEYSLSTKGESLGPVLLALHSWGLEHAIQTPTLDEEKN